MPENTLTKHEDFHIDGPVIVVVLDGVGLGALRLCPRDMTLEARTQRTPSLSAVAEIEPAGACRTLERTWWGLWLRGPRMN